MERKVLFEKTKILKIYELHWMEIFGFVCFESHYTLEEVVWLLSRHNFSGSFGDMFPVNCFFFFSFSFKKK